jgi:hypothetical protein
MLICVRIARRNMNNLQTSENSALSLCAFIEKGGLPDALE